MISQPRNEQPSNQATQKRLQRLVVGGVPEHFNLPWHLAIESKAFAGVDIDVEFVEFPDGTGAMTQALREERIDVAILLTEGCVADLLDGNPSKIVKVYVQSPLIWGIHVAAGSDIEATEQIRGRRYAISRLGSGSHLMGIVDAVERGWDPQEAELVQIRDLDGARESLGTDADVFFWEKYTTNPYVVSGEFRRIGIRKTLWPAFVVCVRTDLLKHHRQEIRDVLEIVNSSCRKLMDNEDAVNLIAQRYRLRPQMVEEWFGLTKWDCGFEPPDGALQTARDYLERINLVGESNLKTRDLWFQI